MKIGYKWLILGLLFVTFFLELGTRQIYSAVLPQLKADFAAQGVTDVGSRRPSIRLDVSALGFLACVLPVLWVARSSSLVECCAALTTLGFALGIYEAAHYPAMFDCIEPRYRSATTGMTGCLAFLMGSVGPFALGLVGERLSMRAAIASLAVFFLAGALTLLPAKIWFFKRDYIEGRVIPNAPILRHSKIMAGGVLEFHLTGEHR